MAVIRFITLMLFITYLYGGCHGEKVMPWAKSYGGANADSAKSIQQTSDGGYILAGNTTFGLERNIWVLKLNNKGSIVWQKTYDGSAKGPVMSTQQTTDGGYVVAGYTTSFGAGRSDMLVLKLNSDGSIVWQKTYGGAMSDLAWSIQQTLDGGYIVAGKTESFGDGVPHNMHNIWVLKLNDTGRIIWQKTYSGKRHETATTIRQTSDGGYIVGGYTTSFGARNYDFWVLKLNSDGIIIWQKIYGGPGDEYLDSLEQTSDGGYIAAGETESFGAGERDIWILKLNTDGVISWQRTYGGKRGDFLGSIQQTIDGGYIVAGSTLSFGVDGWDIWVLKICPAGTISWQKTYGTVWSESASSVQQTSDGGYIVAGAFNSPLDTENGDMLVIKLDSDGRLPSLETNQNVANVTLTSTSVTPSNSSAIASDTDIKDNDTSVAVTDTSAIVKRVPKRPQTNKKKY